MPSGNQGPIHLLIDSSGLRIHVGSARKPPKRKPWRKIHIAVDCDTGDIVAADLTASNAADAARVPALLGQVLTELASVSADGAYDQGPVYEAVQAHSPDRRTRTVIPPHKGAVCSPRTETAMQDRNRDISARSIGWGDVRGIYGWVMPNEAGSKTSSTATRSSWAGR